MCKDNIWYHVWCQSCSSGGIRQKKLTSSPFQLYGFKVLMGMYDFFYTGWAPKIAKLPYKRFNYGL